MRVAPWNDFERQTNHLTVKLYCYHDIWLENNLPHFLCGRIANHFSCSPSHLKLLYIFGTAAAGPSRYLTGSRYTDSAPDNNSNSVTNL